MGEHAGERGRYTVAVYTTHDQTEQPRLIHDVLALRTMPFGVSITCKRSDEDGEHEATYSIKHSGFTRIDLTLSGSPAAPASPPEGAGHG